MPRACAPSSTRAGADVIIVDSLVPASGQDPEGADATIRTLNALRSFSGTTRIVIGHVNRSDADRTHSTGRPWGSVFVRNLARATWEIKRAEADGQDLVLAAYLTKRNDGPRVPPWSLRLAFEGEDLIRVHDGALVQIPELRASATTWQQIRAALATKPKTIKAVASELDLEEDLVRRTVHRYQTKGEVTTVPDTDPLQFALVSRRS